MINLLIFLISIFFVAVYAAFEISYISSDRINIQDAIPTSRLNFFVWRDREVVISILIGINIFSVLAATTLTNYTRKAGFSSNLAVAASGLITTLVIVFLGEIFPKSYAISRKFSVIKNFNFLIYFTYLMFYPLVKFFDFALKLSIARVKSDLVSFERELEKYAEEKGFEKEQLLLLKKALRFYDLDAEDIMIPTHKFPFFPVDTPREKIIENVRKLHYNKVLLYKNTIDNVLGLIHIKDLILGEGNPVEVERYLRPFAIAYSDSPLHRVVEAIKEKQTTVSIVVDEYGSVIGVITIEKIIGELLKYFEENERSGNIYSGDTRITELRERGIFIEEGDYSTLAGLIIDRLERIPEPGEEVEIDGYIFKILEADTKGIKKVLIKEKHETDST